MNKQTTLPKTSNVNIPWKKLPNDISIRDAHILTMLANGTKVSSITTFWNTSHPEEKTLTTDAVYKVKETHSQALQDLVKQYHKVILTIVDNSIFMGIQRISLALANCTPPDKIKPSEAKIWADVTTQLYALRRNIAIDVQDKDTEPSRITKDITSKLKALSNEHNKQSSV